jgi:hypothetical protein
VTIPFIECASDAHLMRASIDRRNYHVYFLKFNTKYRVVDVYIYFCTSHFSAGFLQVEDICGTDSSILPTT